MQSIKQTLEIARHDICHPELVTSTKALLRLFCRLADGINSPLRRYPLTVAITEAGGWQDGSTIWGKPW